MFDRMASVNNESNRTRVAVKLTLDDGSLLNGEFVITGHSDLQSYLNGDRTFYLFASAQGGLCYVSKETIRRIDPVVVKATDQLDRAMVRAERLDPFQVLGIDRNADRETVRAAYHERVKAYHPDRISALSLPPEMVDYSAAMLSRINAAYEQLGH